MSQSSMTSGYPASGNPHPCSTPVQPLVPPVRGMPGMAEKWVTEWLNDAFAIVVRSTPGLTAAETNLRRGLEAIVRHLATSAPPIPDFTRAPDHSGPELSSGDLRSIRQALDACLAIFARHERRLNTAQRRVQILVRACRRNADDALQGDTSAAPFRTRAVDR